MKSILSRRIIIVLAFAILNQGCKEMIPERFVLPQPLSTGNSPIILDYVWLNGCLDCQLLDATRWIRRQQDLERMGDDYKAEIVCIISTRNQSDDSLVEKYFSSINASKVHYIYSRDSVSIFDKINSISSSQRSFTCLLDSTGNVIIHGGQPKKDMDSFKQYSMSIYHYHNNP